MFHLTLSHLKALCSVEESARYGTFMFLCCSRSAEIILVDYHGNLYCYLVSPTDGYQLNHVFSFAQHYRHGVLAVSYHQTHNMLFVAGQMMMKNSDSLKVFTALSSNTF
jgi:hypothetical protein